MQGQFFKDVYKELFKYSTIYVAGDMKNSYEEPAKDYFVRTNPDGSLYDIPVVVDGTNYYKFDYRIKSLFRNINIKFLLCKFYFKNDKLNYQKIIDLEKI